jgi:hypothetical protein
MAWFRLGICKLSSWRTAEGRWRYLLSREQENKLQALLNVRNHEAGEIYWVLQCGLAKLVGLWIPGFSCDVCWRYSKQPAYDLVANGTTNVSFTTLWPVYCEPELLSRHSCSLRAARNGDRILVGRKFSAPVQKCPFGYPVSYTYNDYQDSFSELKRPERGFEQQPPSSSEVKERVELHICFPSGPSRPLIDESYVQFTCTIAVLNLTMANAT